MPKRKSTRQAESAAKRAKEEAPTLQHDLQWSQHGRGENGIPQLVILDGPGAVHSDKVAGFDIDWTITKTKSGRKFPTGPSDWQFLFDEIPVKLRELHESGTKVVFFTNQAGVEKQKISVKELCDKFEAVVNELDIPIQVFVCTGNSHFRKPSVEMWRHLESHCNGGVKISKEKSLFVGDAAGRAKNWAPGKSRDFSSGDRMFAANIGVEFYTPEVFFLGEKEVAFEWKALDPQVFLDTTEGMTAPESLHSDSQEMVLLVGCPSSGKSTLRERYFTPHGYVSVNRDTLVTQEKCQVVASESLRDGKSVVIDNTNPSKAIRKPYIDIARKHGVPVRCLYLDVSRELAVHLNYFRQNQSKGVKRRVPVVGYRVYEKNFQTPEASEGFTEVIRHRFVPHFASRAERELFLHWNSAE